MYIEREALLELITEKFQTHYGNACYQFIHDFFRCVTKLINKAPAANVESVVRCKDCVRRYDHNECPMCFLVGGESAEYTADDGFCDRGEMK